ncbi:hypothetical protein ELE36_07635 [Pseudolysobacter antarcticus]|uniref:PIG-L family deacetylase n=1 Tax=Pseudolysobacter antarcticus TaxID=2511995 RepID=A0A411HIK1_9GAMM|nr:hypothetical protein [Pseudolysobacter antarcticus]QBB70244.1 hypothetical protein ELE36_07635 [Pseudolysobacter antarcticus]
MNERSLLLIGHPGHEFLLYGWVAQTRPIVCILTDGSGMMGTTRIAQSETVLKGLNAPIGPVWGESSDREFYQRILQCDHAFFAATRDRLADCILMHDITTVVSDAIEGYEPTHDICEALARGAVMLASRHAKAPIRHYLISILGNPGMAPLGDGPATVEIELLQEQIFRKRHAIATYATQAGNQLTREIQNAYDRYGIAAFDREYLFDAANNGWPLWHERFHSHAPHYESVGTAHVASGRVQVAITYSDHVAPISERLTDIPCAS